MRVCVCVWCVCVCVCVCVCGVVCVCVCVGWLGNIRHSDNGVMARVEFVPPFFS